ncbi:MAG: TRAM domain-containing protein, partial [Propionibacteriaceae bacterium]|nr:TRAM domain-containing protein [Propionibacteriaceae bacterium]
MNEVIRGVRIERPAHNGGCVARPDGLVVFVQGALPGELVDIELSQRRAKFSRGRVVAVHRAHPERRVPPCPVADRCGGCDWQHATPLAQRELKRQVLLDQLSHAGVECSAEVVAVEP